MRRRLASEGPRKPIEEYQISFHASPPSHLWLPSHRGIFNDISHIAEIKFEDYGPNVEALKAKSSTKERAERLVTYATRGIAEESGRLWMREVVPLILDSFNMGPIWYAMTTKLPVGLHLAF
jgi:hypothetical protein